MVTRFALTILMVSILGCEAEPAPKYEWKTIRVAATAYNSTKHQTQGDPFISAFGDSLKPGMKCIAVSTGVYSRQELLEEKPDLLVASLADRQKILDFIFDNK